MVHGQGSSTDFGKFLGESHMSPLCCSLRIILSSPLELLSRPLEDLLSLMTNALMLSLKALFQFSRPSLLFRNEFFQTLSLMLEIASCHPYV